MIYGTPVFNSLIGERVKAMRKDDGDRVRRRQIRIKPGCRISHLIQDLAHSTHMHSHAHRLE